jgi:hypothetical protein
MQDMISFVTGLGHLKWACAFLYFASLVFSREGTKLTRLGEKAYAEHFDQPTNPVHLARFNAFAARSAGNNTASAICGMAAVALPLAVGWN